MQKLICHPHKGALLPPMKRKNSYILHIETAAYSWCYWKGGTCMYSNLNLYLLQLFVLFSNIRWLIKAKLTEKLTVWMHRNNRNPFMLKVPYYLEFEIFRFFLQFPEELLSWKLLPQKSCTAHQKTSYIWGFFSLLVFQIRDMGQEPCGRLSFLKEPKTTKGLPQAAVCNLNITLPIHKKVGPLFCLCFFVGFFFFIKSSI